MKTASFQQNQQTSHLAAHRASPAPGRGRALYEEFRARIADGTYGAGTPLPSTRALAAERGLSRATVSLVYEQLAAEGYLETRAGAASRVAADAQAPLASLAPPPGSVGAPGTAQATAGPLSAIGRRIAARDLTLLPPPRAGEIDFLYGPLAGADFPTALWLKALRAAERQRQPRLEYEDPRGHPELRRALQAHLSRSRGLACSQEQLLIVNGSQQALDLCARLLLDPGDRVVVENPGYRMAHHVFEAYGAQLACAPVDEHGLVTEQLPALGPARLACVTPTHQFPLGGFLPLARRRQLLDWAAARQAWLIEDDYDSEYRYGLRPEATLQSLDTRGCVIHVGTFSKTLSPQLRLGYMVLPLTLVPLFSAAKRLSDRHAPSAAQRALARLLQDGSYDRHVRRMRRQQQLRQHTLIQALSRHLGGQFELQGTASGLHLVLRLPGLPASAEPALLQAARAQGLRVHPLGPLYHPETTPSQAPRTAGLVMGYALLQPEAIEEGVRRLARALAVVQATATCSS